VLNGGLAVYGIDVMNGVLLDVKFMCQCCSCKHDVKQACWVCRLFAIVVLCVQKAQLEGSRALNTWSLCRWSIHIGCVLIWGASLQVTCSP